MTNISRLKVRWSGTSGGPGVTVLYGTDPTLLRNNLSTMLNTLKNYLPSSVTWTIEAAGDVIDPVDGSLQGAWAAGTEISYTGVATGSFSAPTGYSIRWETGTIVHGHRLRGRTYMVPATGTMFQNDGTIDTTALAAAQALVTTFATGPSTLVVYNRPKGAVAGGYSTVISGSIKDKAVVLTSRRD